MDKFVADGNTVTFAAGGTIASGDVDSMGDMVGVAQNAATSGESVVYAIEGVYLVAKATGAAWAVGDKVNFDTSAGNFTASATAAAGDVTAAGVCMEAAASGATTAKVKLTPGTGTGS